MEELFDLLAGGENISLKCFFFATAPPPKRLYNFCTQGFGIFGAADDAQAVAGLVRAGKTNGNGAFLCDAVAQLPIGGGRKIFFKMQSKRLAPIALGNIGE